MLALALCVTVAAPGCASARWNHAGVPSHQLGEPGQGVDPATLADYLKTLPLGKTIRVERVDGQSLRGTLLKVTDRSLTVSGKNADSRTGDRDPVQRNPSRHAGHERNQHRQDDRHRRRRGRRSGAHRLLDPRRGLRGLTRKRPALEGRYPSISVPCSSLARLRLRP